MRVGIVAEGRSDMAVLKNVLKGTLGVDQTDIQPLLPEYFFDQTDLHEMAPEEFSNWTLVKQQCITKERITPFFNVIDDDDRFLVIQIDTAERQEVNYGVNEPPKSKNAKEYSRELRLAVIAKINDWLNNNFTEKIAYAVTIEETDAWVMALYIAPNVNVDTSSFPKPKERLWKDINKNMPKKDQKTFFQLKMDIPPKLTPKLRSKLTP